MVWFRDPALDPRLAVGRPTVRGDLRMLTKAELRAAKETGQAVIARRVGAWRGDPFLDRLRVDSAAVDRELDEAVDRLVARVVPNVTDRLQA